ncbi:MAG: ribonuclease III [Bacteroidetes bacterium]|nr:ribonuclease III [Bacteroidota bacterium]
MGRLTSRLLNYISGSKPLALQLEHLLGFRPVHLPYYELALMHRSKIDDHNQNNERLEFLGDAILGSIVAEYLFKKYPNQQEGFLTEMRSRIVRRETLNNVALRMGLNKLVQFNQNDRGLGRSHIFGNALEALIGAVYLDIGFTRTRTFILRQIIKTYIDLDQMEATDTNYKNQLLSWAQRNAYTLSFETIEEKQEGSRKVFSVGILLNGKLLTTGNGYTKKDAGQVAAQKALEQIKTLSE